MAFASAGETYPSCEVFDSYTLGDHVRLPSARESPYRKSYVRFGCKETVS